MARRAPFVVFAQLKMLLIPALMTATTVLFAATASAAQSVTLYLNWKPGPEHAPIYYAQKTGLYSRAGIDVTVQAGAGSASTLKLLSEKSNAIGVADFASLLNARGKGANVVAVMNMFANSPYTFLWLKGSGIQSIRDLPGKRIGMPERDPVRRLWRALAEANGIDPDSVTWVNMENDAKVDSLRQKKIDATINGFPDSFTTFPTEFGDALVQVPWRSAGFNPYSNSLVAPSALIASDPKLVSAVVRATQRAEAECLANPAPCFEALVAASPGLERERELANWNAVRELFYTPEARGLPLGAFDAARVRGDYEVVRKVIGIDKAFDPSTAFTNDFLDRSIATPH